MREEAEEASKLGGILSGLVGEEIGKRYELAAWLLVMFVVLEGIGWMLARHTRRTAIRAPVRPSELGVPFVSSAFVTFAVAALVTYLESVDPKKTEFDAVSYCFGALPFWLAHAALAPIALVVAAPLAIGWYASRSDHLPQLDKTRASWGVRSYVNFIETWSFLGIALTGVSAAAWMHTIADAPSKTHYVVAFLGAGTVVVVLAIIVRFLRCGWLLHRRYIAEVERNSDWKNLPDDPLDGFVGDRWWVTPVALVAAFALAYQALQLAGALKFMGAE